MLFDLRSRGRRRTVQAIYLFLAILIGGGLVLFGVGAGNGIGGLLNGLGGNGSSSNQTSVVSQQEQQALKQTRANPGSAPAWAALLQAQHITADQNGAINQTTGVAAYNATGKKELAALTNSWQRYVSLTKSPDPDLAVIAGRAYASLGNFAAAADAFSTEAQAAPTNVLAFECMSLTAYAAKQTRKGDLAMDKSLSLLPKAQQTTAKAQLQAAKSSAQSAQTEAQQYCS